MKKFKIEYEPEYIKLRYKVYRSVKNWFNSKWELMGSFETEEEAKEEIKKIVMFPKTFEGDTTEGIYN